MGDSNRGANVSWIKWADVCKAKRVGSLGAKGLRLINFILLNMWRWAILLNLSSMWRDIFVVRYGSYGFWSLLGGMARGLKRVS